MEQIIKKKLWPAVHLYVHICWQNGLNMNWYTRLRPGRLTPIYSVHPPCCRARAVPRGSLFIYIYIYACICGQKRSEQWVGSLFGAGEAPSKWSDHPPCCLVYIVRAAIWLIDAIIGRSVAVYNCLIREDNHSVTR